MTLVSRRTPREKHCVLVVPQPDRIGKAGSQHRMATAQRRRDSDSCAATHPAMALHSQSTAAPPAGGARQSRTINHQPLARGGGVAIPRAAPPPSPPATARLP